jgi:hypothetical protein
LAQDKDQNGPCEHGNKPAVSIKGGEFLDPAKKVKKGYNTKDWLENLRERDHLEDLGVDGRIILERILDKRGESCGLDSSAELGPVAGSYEHVMNLRVP